MKTKTIYTLIDTDQPLGEVKKACQLALRNVGGSGWETETGLVISNGKNQVDYGFAADLMAHINVRPTRENQYEIECVLSWKMNALSWICLGVGFFVLGVLWIVPLLYLFVDPLYVYQQSLARVPSFLGEEGAVNMPPMGGYPHA